VTVNESPVRERIGIGIVLLVAFGLRLPGIWQSLPYVFHWDEPTLVNLAVWLWAEGSLNPHYFNYPAGMVYLLAVLFGFTLLFGRAFGAFPGFAEGFRRLASGTYPRPPDGELIYRFPTRGVPILYVLGRLVSAAVGTLCVWWSFRLGRILGGSRVAWLAGILLAFNSLHAANSALITTDVACGAGLTWFLWCLLSGASPRRAGIALGLAAAGKYTGGIGLYLWPLGWFVPVTASGRGEWNRLWVRLVPWALGTFLVLNPFVVLTPRAFLHGFQQEALHMQEGTAHFGEGVAIGPTGPVVVTNTLWRELGALPLIGFACALIAAFAVRREDERARRVLLLGAWCLLYLVQLATWRTAYPRYLLPIWPALTVVSAWGWVRMVELASTRMRPLLRKAPVVAGAMAVAVVPGLLPLARTIAVRLRPDPRVEMSTVIERSLDPSGAIAAEPGGPWIDDRARQVIKTDVLGRAGPETWRRRGVRYLLATGREMHLPAGSPDSLLANRQRLEREGRVVWRNGRYVIYDLGEGSDPLSKARRLLKAGRVREARDQLETFCLRDPISAPAVVFLGDACLALGDTLAAMDAYTRASRIDPKDPIPFLALGSIALNARHWDAAVASFLHARELSPREPAAAHNLATALISRAQAAIVVGRRGEAARDLNEAALLARLVVSMAPEEARFRLLEAKTRELAVRWQVPLSARN
jgi:4-amino-4-deoxy-L-arabinose transferase-like glycosyltransferase